MPLFLFWYILRDLLKILAISTLVLVSVISFGAAIQPLSEGLIGPWRLLVFILLAMPPMLQFALPFSATFSATIVYHRMAQDNELSACAASGVPYAHILLPAASLGVVMTIGLSLLTNYICPRFWEAMNRTAHLDAPEFFVRSVQHGEAIEAEDLLIRAQSVERIEPAPGSNAYASLRVHGLVVMILDQGRAEAIGSAPQGVFNLTQARSGTVVTSIFDELVVMNEDNDDLLLTRESQFEPWVIPNTFKDSPKFMDLSELRGTVSAPETFWRVAEKINGFRIWLAKRQLYLDIEAQLRSTGRAVLTGLPREDEAESELRIEIYGGSLGRFNPDVWRVQPGPSSERVRVVKFVRGRPDVELVGEDVSIRPRLTSMLVEPTLSISMQNPSLKILASGVTTRKPKASISRLHSTKLITARIRDLTVQELADLSHQYGDDEVVLPMSRAIVREIDRVYRNILSRIHERTALSVSCLVMMLLGATLAIRLRTSLPLTVYLFSFIPAIIGLVLISTGADMLRTVDAPNSLGLLIIWSGNLAMVVFALLTLRRVART